MAVRALSHRAGQAFGRLARVDVYRCFTRAWRMEPDPAVHVPKQSIEIRAVDRSELAAFSQDPRQEISPDFLRGLAGRGDLCLGAFQGDELLSYCFFAVGATAIDAYLRFRYPRGWIYVYKSFTLPEWRGRRLLRAILREAAHAELWRALVQQPRGFVTLALTRNRPSLEAFSKAGFRPVADLPVLVLRARPRVLLRSKDPTGFTIERIDP